MSKNIILSMKFIRVFGLIFLVACNTQQFYKQQWFIGTCKVGDKEIRYIVDGTFTHTISGKSLNYENCEGILDFQTGDIKSKDVPARQHYATCRVEYYEIEFVDELVYPNCYAWKSAEPHTFVYDDLNKSFQFAGESVDSIWTKTHPNEDCETISSLNGYHELPVFCLKNKSTCLIVEDNKICQKIDMLLPK